MAFLHKSIPTVTNFVFVVAMITQKEYPVDFGGTFVTFVTLSSRQNKDHITKILFHICMNNIFEHVSIFGNWNFVHTMYVSIGALLCSLLNFQSSNCIPNILEPFDRPFISVSETVSAFYMYRNNRLQISTFLPNIASCPSQYNVFTVTAQRKK